MTQTTKEWLCGQCGYANNGVICTKCGAASPTQTTEKALSVLAKSTYAELLVCGTGYKQIPIILSALKAAHKMNDMSLKIERLQNCIIAHLQEMNVSEGSIPEVLRHIEEGTTDDDR